MLSRYVVRFAIILGLCTSAPAVQAGTVVVDGFRSVQAPSVEGLALEYHLAPFFQRGATRLSWAFRLKLDDGENAWAGFGLNAQRDFGKGWFAEAGVMPGYYSAGLPKFDLGSDLEIYSFAALGHRIGPSSAVALSAGHMSNANITDRNPGRNFVTLRISTEF